MCVLMVTTAVVFGKVAYAASGMPEFGEILANNLDALQEFFKNNLKILELIW